MISVATAATIILAASLLMLGDIANAGDRPKVDPPKQIAAAPKRLDLRAPDITKVFSPAQLNEVLSKALDPRIEEVEVEGRRSGQPVPPSSPTVWPAIAAPFWAVMHPTQSWRIVAPMPPDQASRVGNAAPDATDPSRAVPIPR
ncbi:MAG TPA: hypothetical protein VGN07_12820 [Steroidobacteraceae bacterium]|jgi:hypothetical protein